MVQWDTDLVQEYDTNVLLRCDRPDDYNRTIKFDLTSVVGENRQTLVKTHPGKEDIQSTRKRRKRTLMLSV